MLKVALAGGRTIFKRQKKDGDLLICMSSLFHSKIVYGK